MELSDARYARSGDVHIAYNVIGDGAVDLVFDYGWITHTEALWGELSFARLCRQLARFARVVLFDRRGHGLSDNLQEGKGPLLEQRIDDVRAVMDAIGSERAFLLGTDVGGRMAALFAATHPERVAGLILYGSMAKIGWEPDYREGIDRELFDGFVAEIDRGWGEATTLPFLAPLLATDDRFVKWWGRYERSAMSPGTMVTLLQLDWQDDVRSVLSSISVPTLVLHRSGDLLVGIDNGRYLARHIPGARFVELPGDDHLPYLGDTGQLIEEIEEFVTGNRHVPEPERVLATVLFTDIVGSTDLAARMGDEAWRRVLDEHEHLVLRQTERFRGRVIKTTGDGALAAFDGPARAIECALELRSTSRTLGIELRTGLHTGEVELRGSDLGGIAVHIGARIAALAEPGHVFVSRTVRDLVAGSALAFESRGSHSLKGVPGEWEVFAVA